MFGWAKGPGKLHICTVSECQPPQDFMGFLHLGWDIAAREESGSDGEAEALHTPAWQEVAQHMDLQRPGLGSVRRTMGWGPIHMAAMEGHVDLLRRLVLDLGCCIHERSANSWTPLHYAAAHNQVLDSLRWGWPPLPLSWLFKGKNAKCGCSLEGTQRALG